MKNELSVDVSVNICVDKKTAEKCLRLVELYLDGHKDEWILAKTGEDGCTRFEIESRKKHEPI